MGRMPPSPSFAAWLRTAPESAVRALAATRTDLLRTDVADLSRMAALAASRAAVARGLESLNAAALRVVHRATVLARVSPVVDRTDLLAAALHPAPEAVLDSCVRAGLLWPASDPDPAVADRFRVQPEAAGFLPVTAAERAVPAAWESARDPRPLSPVPVSPALRENAQGAGAAQATALALTAVGEFAARDVSQLVSGGVGKREAQALARGAGTDDGTFALVVELAGALGWLGTTRDPADPQWKPTAEYDAATRAPRARVWGELLTAWLTHPVDIAHVRAGMTPAGERTHLLGRDDRGRSAFPGFPSARPPILTLRRLVLVTLRREAGGQAIAQDDLLAVLAFAHPLLAAVTEDELAQVLAEAEVFGLTASPLGRADAHALTPFGTTVADWLIEVDDPDDVLGERIGVEAGPPAALLDAVAAALPPLESTVTLQSDLTAVAFGPLENAVQARLERIADVDTRGQGTVYRFTDESVGRGLRAGESVDSVLAALTEMSRTEVPTTLQHMVTAAAARLRRIRVARGRSVIVVDDPTDLDLVLDDPAAVALGLRRLAPTVAVADASSDRVSALLETEDRPVLLVDDDAEAAAGTRAPVPSPVPVPTVRTTRVPRARIEAHIDGLLAQRVGGGAGGGAAGNSRGRGAVGFDADASGGTGDSPVDAMLAELGEAAAVGAAVELTVTTSDGTRRTVRAVPQAVRAGRLLGRTDSGTALRVSLSRIVAVRRADN